MRRKCKIVLHGYRYLYTTEDIYPDAANDVVARFDTSTYELDRPLPKGKNKKKLF